MLNWGFPSLDWWMTLRLTHIDSSKNWVRLQ